MLLPNQLPHYNVVRNFPLSFFGSLMKKHPHPIQFRLRVAHVEMLNKLAESHQRSRAEILTAILDMAFGTTSHKALPPPQSLNVERNEFYKPPPFVTTQFRHPPEWVALMERARKQHGYNNTSSWIRATIQGELLKQGHLYTHVPGDMAKQGEDIHSLGRDGRPNYIEEGADE